MATTNPPAVLSSTEEVSDNRQVSVLLDIYNKDIKPIEDMYSYSTLEPGYFQDSIDYQRPCVAFLGPWSAGKTSFINHLLQQNYLRTGAEPTTSDFTVVFYGNEAGPVDGVTLANAKNLPFRDLNSYGSEFLQNFNGFQAPHPLLRHITLIDTPGVLENADDIHRRKYDYHKMARWFVEKCDLVFVLFDPTKLDAGEELRLLFEESLRGHEQKTRIILNKADKLTSPELMKVYGALLWNLSGVMTTTEPPRIYVGSFWDKPYEEGSFTRLFTDEKDDLMYELLNVVPVQAWDRKVSMVLRRAKRVLAHAGVVSKMHSNLPLFGGKSSSRKSALKNLPDTYKDIADAYGLNIKDFPSASKYEEFLDKVDLEKFPSLEKIEKKNTLENLLNAVRTTLPSMLKPVRGTRFQPADERKERTDLVKMYSSSSRLQCASHPESSGSDSPSQSVSMSINNGSTFPPHALAQTGSNLSAAQRQNEMMSQMMLMMQKMLEKKQQQPTSQPASQTKQQQPQQPQQPPPHVPARMSPIPQKVSPLQQAPSGKQGEYDADGFVTLPAVPAPLPPIKEANA